ncbi:MAG: FecR family protein [Gammaproteobacteria bacterium]
MTSASDESTDVVGKIIRAAGRRAVAPEATRDRVFAVASAALEVKLSARRRQVLWRSAMVASVALMVIGIGLAWLQNRPAMPVAISDQFIGEVAYRASVQDKWTLLIGNRRLPADSQVRTGRSGRVGLILAQGASLRLDQDTVVRLAGTTTVELLTGTVYVDSRTVGSAINIVTPNGVARDVGTQFEVRYIDGEERIRVREGAVLFTLGNEQQYRGRAGEQLSVSSTGQVQRTTVAIDDASWDWVQLVARAPEIDNRPLSELLDWVARETGRPIQYESAAIQALAKSTILHGSVRNLAPLAAAQTVLATTDLDSEILPDGSLLVKGRDRSDQLR